MVILPVSNSSVKVNVFLVEVSLNLDEKFRCTRPLISVFLQVEFIYDPNEIFTQMGAYLIGSAKVPLPRYSSNCHVNTQSEGWSSYRSYLLSGGRSSSFGLKKTSLILVALTSSATSSSDDSAFTKIEGSGVSAVRNIQNKLTGSSRK